MENKYYTPEIEEFCVGFEFEQLENNNWEKTTLEPCETERFFVMLNAYKLQDFVRVKHLDKEDIESLGWKFSNINTAYFYLNGFNLVFNNIWVTIYEDKGADEYSFRGTIKNKSELRKLMQQLNINSGGK